MLSNKLIPSLVLVALSLILVEAAPFDGRVVDGKDAVLGQFPYQVSLRVSSGHAFCGGVVVSDQWILTAAHCVMNQKMFAFVGTVKVSEGEKYEIVKAIPHENYLYLFNDIALLKTDRKIEFNQNVQPIKIRSSPAVGNETVIASGWGMLSYPGNQAENLQYVELKTIDNETCQKTVDPEAEEFVYEGCLCTFTRKGQGVCKGDSGGPLALDGELVGITSWGTPCADGYPDVFTRVSHFSKWIEENMK